MASRDLIPMHLVNSQPYIAEVAAHGIIITVQADIQKIGLDGYSVHRHVRSLELRVRRQARLSEDPGTSLFGRSVLEGGTLIAWCLRSTDGF